MMDRVALIEASLKVFTCGLLSFIPGFGIVPAILALLDWRRIRSQAGGQWNPASGYLLAGVIISVFSLLSFLVLALSFLVHFLI